MAATPSKTQVDAANRQLQGMHQQLVDQARPFHLDPALFQTLVTGGAALFGPGAQSESPHSALGQPPHNTPIHGTSLHDVPGSQLVAQGSLGLAFVPQEERSPHAAPYHTGYLQQELSHP